MSFRSEDREDAQDARERHKAKQDPDEAIAADRDVHWTRDASEKWTVAHY